MWFGVLNQRLLHSTALKWRFEEYFKTHVCILPEYTPVILHIRVYKQLFVPSSPSSTSTLWPVLLLQLSGHWWLTLCGVFQGGSMPNTSSSVPFLLSSSMQSIRSRRPSACLTGSQGSGLLQQLGSGMVRQLSASQQSNGRAFPGANVRQCPSLTVSRSLAPLSASGTALSVAHTRHSLLPMLVVGLGATVNPSSIGTVPPDLF